MTESLIIGAFLGGLISFLAPCVLPIIPGFLAYLAGTTTSEAQRNLPAGRQVFINSVFFVLGFGIVFAFLGVLLNTLLENIAYDVQTWLSRIGGVMIIFFGLYWLRISHKMSLSAVVEILNWPHGWRWRLFRAL